MPAAAQGRAAVNRIIDEGTDQGRVMTFDYFKAADPRRAWVVLAGVPLSAADAKLPMPATIEDAS